jgi:hypothetical protein
MRGWPLLSTASSPARPGSRPRFGGDRAGGGQVDVTDLEGCADLKRKNRWVAVLPSPQLREATLVSKLPNDAAVDKLMAVGMTLAAIQAHMAEGHPGVPSAEQARDGLLATAMAV